MPLELVEQSAVLTVVVTVCFKLRCILMELLENQRAPTGIIP